MGVNRQFEVKTVKHKQKTHPEMR